MSSASQAAICPITGKILTSKDMIPLASLRPALTRMIQIDYPDLTENDVISRQAVNDYRIRYVRHALEEERGSLGELEAQVLESLRERDLLSLEIGKDIEEGLTFGQRLADRIASFGGSWSFILLFGAGLVGWIVLNTLMLGGRAFDPYPYILMNLILSCLAALQAPVIMMSQNRAASRDRVQAENDYQINLKAELEIRHLHEKMDHLLKQQHVRLLEIQEIQIDLLTELGAGKKLRKPTTTPGPGTPG